MKNKEKTFSGNKYLQVLLEKYLLNGMKKGHNFIIAFFGVNL